ncbi:ABC-2 family transporter protein [Candidatus Collierbacteria bacterium]|nr:ABC-2 family transporter protein [Candidatus Collierbacteria bacterium]
MLLTSYFLWQAVFKGRTEIFGYSQNQMLSYIMLAAVLQSMVLASRSIDLAGVINSGELSNIIIRPISNLWYWLSRDAADKALNLIFSGVEISLLIILLKPPLAWPGFSLSAVSLLLILPPATLLYYFINYLFGLTGFWTNEVWAPRFLLMVVLQFLAGLMFPLDVLPQTIQNLAMWTPFPYLVYFPAQVMLAKVSWIEAWRGISATVVWMIIFGAAVEVVWRKGLRAYGAEGR